MKALILAMPLLVLVACSQSGSEAGQADVQQSVQMPPKTKHAYLDVEPAMLASLKDPVCGMSVKNKVIDTATYNHHLYGFCGTGCKVAFLKEPLQYKVATDAEPKQ